MQSEIETFKVWNPIRTLLALGIALPVLASQPNPANKVIAVVLNLGDRPQAKVESVWLKNALEMGFDKLRPLLNEKNITVQYFNDDGTIEGAIAISKQLEKIPNVKVILSGYSSKTAIPLAQNLKNKNLINMYSTSGEATKIPDFHVSLLAENAVQGRNMAQFAMTSLHSKRPCMLFEADDAFSLSVKKEAAGNLEKHNILLSHFSYSQMDENTIHAAIHSCYNTNPDVILHSGRSVSAKIFLNYHLKHRPDIPIIGSDGWGDIKLILGGESNTLLARTRSNVFITHYWDEQMNNPVQLDIETIIRSKYNEIGCALVLVGFDAAVLATSFTLSTESSLSDFLKHAHHPVIPLAILGITKRPHSLPVFGVPLEPSIYQLLPDRKLKLQAKPSVD